MTRVHLATFNLLPGGEVGAELLTAALAEREIEAEWACWDDPDVDWAAADLVVVRSTWDYHRRISDFLAWARKTESEVALLNGAETFAWNCDKRYLLDLAADGVPVIPTTLLDDTNLIPGLTEGLGRYSTVILKPRTGAGGVGVVVAEDLQDPRLEGLTAAPWVLQPLVESVRTTGETSVYVFDGKATSQVDKLPANGEIRVHEQYGGRSRPTVVAPEAAEIALGTVAAAAERLGTGLDYARVDMMRWRDGWAVSELELIEPGLYLDVVPGNAETFADAVARRLA